ncbi:hypothetical protein MASR2M47_45350 [Draconibacterium sp.]
MATNDSCNDTGCTDADIEPRIAMQIVNEAALCSNRVRRGNYITHQGFELLNGLDRGYPHFKNYIALGICAYNLKKIGAKLLEEEREKIKAQGKIQLRKAA